MLYSLEDVRPGWSVRVVAGIRRAPTHEEWKHGGVAFGEKQLHVIAVIRKVHPRPFLDPPKGTMARLRSRGELGIVKEIAVDEEISVASFTDSLVIRQAEALLHYPRPAAARKPAAPIG